MHVHEVRFDTLEHEGIPGRVVLVGATTADRFDEATRHGWNLVDEKTLAWAEVRVYAHTWAPAETMGLHASRGDRDRDAAIACLPGLLAAAWEIVDAKLDHGAARERVIGRLV